MEFRVFAIILFVAVTTVYSQDIMTLCQQTQIRPGAHFVRSPNNCSEFYTCNFMSFRPQSCPRDTVFSQSQQNCVWRKSQYDDCDRQIYGGRFNDPLCNAFPFGNNRDPQDCTRYIPCFNRTSYPSMACQSSLFFNVEKQRCTAEAPRNCATQLITTRKMASSNTMLLHQ
ncbi:uncharacterized protein LOC115213546 [Argonauta hians]